MLKKTVLIIPFQGVMGIDQSVERTPIMFEIGKVFHFPVGFKSCLGQYFSNLVACNGRNDQVRFVKKLPIIHILLPSI
jgi:hypothetical protein